MRKISGKEYAEFVDDVITGCLEKAVDDSARQIARHFGLEIKVDNAVSGFWFGPMATVRDQIVELFEMNGMDIKPDNYDW